MTRIIMTASRKDATRPAEDGKQFGLKGGAERNVLETAEDSMFGA